MSNIFIIHGAYGSPQENWFPWLKQKLEDLGHEVIVPEFPTPVNQSLESWNKVFSTFSEQINEDSVFVGHSLAPLFILHILEQPATKAKAAFFVSGFLRALNNETFDKINKTFISNNFNWEEIKRSCQKFFVYHSDNDPHVPLEYGKELAKKLGVKAKIIKNAGHFNEAAGYKTFKRLLEDIQSVV